MIKKKQSKFSKFIESKGKWAVGSLIVFALIGVTAIVVGYGIQDGWDAVLAWFSSRWAIYIYITIAILCFVIVWAIHTNKMRD